MSGREDLNNVESNSAITIISGSGYNKNFPTTTAYFYTVVRFRIANLTSELAIQHDDAGAHLFIRQRIDNSNYSKWSELL